MSADDVQRLLGRFDEFQKWEDKAHQTIEKRLETIESKVDSLRLAKAKVSGGTWVVMGLISVVFSVASSVLVAWASK